MKHFFRDGRGMAVGQSDKVIQLYRYKIGTSLRDKYLPSRPIEPDNRYRLLHCVSRRIGTQRKDEQEANRNEGISVHHTAYSLWPKAFIIIFCVLFSGLLASPAFGQEAKGLTKIKLNPSSMEFLQNSVKPRSYNEDPDKILKRFPSANLGKYPSVFYDVDGTPVDLVDEGEVIPDYILDMPLWVLNYPDPLTDVITLRQLAGKGFLLLEFWNSHCKPCLESVIRWEESQSSLEGDVHFLGIALDQPYRVPLEIEKRNWTSTHVMGRSALALSKFFFNRFSMGPLVWIKDGKLFGISQGIPKDPQLFKDILSGGVAALPAEITFKRD